MLSGATAVSIRSFARATVNRGDVFIQLAGGVDVRRCQPENILKFVLAEQYRRRAISSEIYTEVYGVTADEIVMELYSLDSLPLCFDIFQQRHAQNPHDFAAIVRVTGRSNLFAISFGDRTLHRELKILNLFSIRVLNPRNSFWRHVRKRLPLRRSRLCALLTTTTSTRAKTVSSVESGRLSNI